MSLYNNPLHPQVTLSWEFLEIMAQKAILGGLRNFANCQNRGLGVQ